MYINVTDRQSVMMWRNFVCVRQIVSKWHALAKENAAWNRLKDVLPQLECHSCKRACTGSGCMQVVERECKACYACACAAEVAIYKCNSLMPPLCHSRLLFMTSVSALACFAAPCQAPLHFSGDESVNLTAASLKPSRAPAVHAGDLLGCQK